MALCLLASGEILFESVVIAPWCLGRYPWFAALEFHLPSHACLVHVSSLSTRKCPSLLAPSSASPKASAVFWTLNPVQRFYNATQSLTLRTLEPTLDRIDNLTRDSFDRQRLRFHNGRRPSTCTVRLPVRLQRPKLRPSTSQSSEYRLAARFA